MNSRRSLALRLCMACALLGPLGYAAKAQSTAGPASIYEKEIPLFELLTQGDLGQGAPITQVKQWEKRRQSIRQKWIRDLLGAFPEKTPLEIKELEQVEHPGYTQKKIAYTTNGGEWVTAYLLIPSERKARNPAMLALQTTHGHGAAGAVGMDENEQRAYGKDLVLKGFVVLAPDVLSAGERIFSGHEELDTQPFYDKNPSWSMMGKMIWDHMRGVDVLASLPYVDPNRIGAIGWSLGGHNAAFLAAFDERIACAVSVGGMAMFAGHPNPFRWTREGQSGHDVARFVYMPRLRPYLERGVVPFDLHEIEALIAPRPYLDLNCAPGDLWKGAVVAAARVTPVYELYGRPDHFAHRVFDGPHSFQPAMKELAYAWLQHWLAPKPGQQ
jgi:dienelactone hydrolase